MTSTFTPEPWEAPVSGHWRRDFRIAEWLPAPMSPSFETWLLPLLEDAFRDASETLFHFRLGDRLHVTVNGWYFTNEGAVDGLVRTLARHPRAMLAQGMALATFPTKPERARDVLARPGRTYHETVVQPALQTALADSAAGVDEDPVGTVERLGRASGAALLTIVTTVGYASKAEYALARFLRTHLPGGGPCSHLLLLTGVVDPAQPQSHDVVSLDWVEPTFGELAVGPHADPVALTERHHRLRADADAEAERCRSDLAGAKRERFDQLLALARAAIADREALASSLTYAWPALRAAMAAVGERLAADGVLAEAADVYFLERDEILAACAGDAGPRADAVAERRARRDAQRRLAAPLSLGPVAGPWKQEAKIVETLCHPLDPGVDPVLQGVPTSAGVTEGPVRVVLGPDDFTDLVPGEILVAPLTAPAWTPLFALAAAVVTDSGSPFSHTSVVAREYGIPAVVGTGDATTALRTGDLVRVDGHTGAVTRLDPHR